MALSAPHVLRAALEYPPAATLSNALASGGHYFSLLTDLSVIIYCCKGWPEKFQVITTLACPDTPEAHGWAADGSLFVLASACRLQVSDLDLSLMQLFFIA